MSATKAFLDTNILIYIYSVDEHIKRKQAIQRINVYDRVINTQVLTEFCSVSIHKLKVDSQNIEAAVNKICRKNEVVIINVDTIKLGLNIQKKYHYRYYDSIIIASALENECEFLLSEDMADGQVIEKKLTIRNIFLPSNSI
jgi:predicted nucleic acid-binding protein